VAARVAIINTGVIVAAGNSGITSISPLTGGSLGCIWVPVGFQIFTFDLSNVRLLTPNTLPWNVIAQAVPVPLKDGAPNAPTKVRPTFTVPGIEMSVNT